MRVLVVDDEPNLARALARIIGQLGHTVLIAHSPIDAIDQADKERLDVAIIDWELRHATTGVDVARHIRERWPGCATLLCSGYTLAHMRASWKDPLTGMLEFLEKPVDVERLRRILTVVQDSLEDTEPGRT